MLRKCYVFKYIGQLCHTDNLGPRNSFNSLTGGRPMSNLLPYHRASASILENLQFGGASLKKQLCQPSINGEIGEKLAKY